MGVALLAALKFAPTVLSLGRSLVETFTGKPVAETTTPEELATHIEGLPDDQRAAITQGVLQYQARLQSLDTDRFLAMNDGDADKLRSSARPQIALQAMAVISVFAWAMKIIVIVTVGEWLARVACGFFEVLFPAESLWDLFAMAEPIQNMIWPPLIASFWVCADIIKKYMGVRERDKAQEYEIQAGKPLNSAAATVAAAGGDIVAIIKAMRGK